MSIQVVTSSIGEPVKSAKEIAEVTDSKTASEQVNNKAQDEIKEVSEASENEVDESAKDDTEVDVKNDSEEVSEGDQGRKPKNGFKKRIDKLSKQKAEAQAKAEYWESEFYKAKTSKNQEPQQKEALKKETVTDDKPKADNFDTHSDYIEALTDWKVEQKEKQRELKQRETQLKTEQQEKVTTFQTKIADFKKLQNDFDEAIESVDDIPMALGVQEAILQSDVGPQVMYELAKNRDEYERINKLSPIAAAREIGKIEARFSKSESKQVEKKQTKAPAPIKPVGSNSSGSAKKSIFDPDLSQSEYEALRAKRA